MKKLSRSDLKIINGGACPGGCPYPPGTGYGPTYSIYDSRTCEAFRMLSNCCQNQSFLDRKCGILVDP